MYVQNDDGQTVDKLYLLEIHRIHKNGDIELKRFEEPLLSIFPKVTIYNLSERII